MTLEESRCEIDRIDSGILELFAQRMAVSDNIARVKLNDGISILNREREQEILDKAKTAVPERYAEYAVALLSHIMELSRDRQHDILTFEGSRRADLKVPSARREELSSPRVAAQGVPGSYAGIAASKLYPSGKLIFVDNWEQVLRCLEDGSADYGVLPVENSTAGSVIDVYDLLFKYKYNIVKALRMPVSHCLLGVCGAAEEDVKNVYSHPHAFPQCSSFFLRHPDYVKNPYYNTAMAAQLVAGAGDRSKAAIASPECASIYGLDVLDASIQDTDDNCTRFVSVSKVPEVHDSANKISLVISLPHVTGSLYRTLARFAQNGHNLTKIESRPDPKTPFEYYFYVDFEGNLSSPKTSALLGALQSELPFFHFFGNYEETGAR